MTDFRIHLVLLVLYTHNHLLLVLFLGSTSYEIRPTIRFGTQKVRVVALGQNMVESEGGHRH